ncbi:uncharacterized protein LOC142322672 [Lycorma delicatula]|uniref:uncharacterized protein LOC142322672 n=1 Tax=Lycorma delicatula TaxID=130591 RepID=UPI003F511286
MEVIERTQYDTCITGDNKTDSGNCCSKQERIEKKDSDCLPLLSIKQECDYVARSDIKYGCNENKKLKEKSGKISKVIGDLFQRSDHLNKNIGGLHNNSIGVKQIVENEITFESRQIISEILEQIDTLSNIEKLFLYLKLPKGSDVTDPLKQPLNPLGNRLEISQTITWIKANFEENPNVSIPKQVVYGEYMEYCDKTGVKPLSNADFGKVMKQVFSHVRPRRLGTRGNSRYCYSGMSKKRTLSPPTLPEITSENSNSQVDGEELYNESSQTTVCQWASEQLGQKFVDLTELATYLQVNHLCTISKQNESHSSISTGTGQNEKLEQILNEKRMENKRKRKDNLLLNSDLKEKTVNRSPCLVKRKRAKTNNNKDACSKGKKVNLKQSYDDFNEAVTDVTEARTTEHQSKTICDNFNPVQIPVDGIAPLAGCNDLIKPDESTKQKDSLFSIAVQKETVLKRCLRKTVGNSVTDFLDLHTESNKVEVNKEVSVIKDLCNKKNNDKLDNTTHTSKLPIPRLSKLKSKSKEVPANIIILPAVPPQIKPKQYKRIKPRPEKEETADGFKKPESGIEGKVRSVNVAEKLLFADLKDKSLCSEYSIGCLGKDALDDYLDGDGNSQEQEEELLQYFQQNDVHPSNNKPEIKLENSTQSKLLVEGNVTELNRNKSEFALEKTGFTGLGVNVNNLIRNSVDSTVLMTNCDTSDSNKDCNNLLLSPRNQHFLKSDLVFPSVLNINTGLNVRRRVSFDNLPSHIPQNVNIRRQVCRSFTPISPTDKIKATSTNDSPFVSPRSTPCRMKTSLNLQSVNLSPVSTTITSGWCSGSSTPSSLQSNIVSSPSPSPSFRTRSHSNAVKLPENARRFSPFQDARKSQADALRSPVCSSSTSQGIFITPCSPLQVCDSSVFNIHKKHSSPNISEKIINKSENFSEIQGTSLLESILLSGKQSDYKSQEEKELLFVKVEDSMQSPKSSSSSGRVQSTDPLSQEVSQFFPEEDTQQLPALEFQPTLRSQSVPMVSSNALISPLSLTQPATTFFNGSTNFGSSIPPTPVPSELVDFGGSFNTESSSSNFLLASQGNDPGDVSDFNEQNTAQNNILLESDITTNLKSIFELINDDCKSLLNSPENCNKFAQQISRSHPSTPIPSYTNSNNSDKCDPIVSAFSSNVTIPCSQISRSYPSTPVVPVPGLSEVISEFLSNNNQNSPQDMCDSETGRSINSLIENTHLLTEDDGLTLQSLAADLPECEDTFNDLEKEVNNPLHENDLT